MDLDSSKSPKNEVFRGFSKNLIHSDIHAFLLHHKGIIGLLPFCKNNMFKNLKANQKTGFFKLEYLRNKLRYKVEFLEVHESNKY